MDNSHNEKDIKFIEIFLDGVHSNFEAERKYGEFIRKFEGQLGGLGRNIFTYLKDSIEKAWRAKITLNSDLFSVDMIDFFKHYIDDYGEYSLRDVFNVSSSREKLMNIELNDVTTLHSSVLNEISISLLKNLPKLVELKSVVEGARDDINKAEGRIDSTEKIISNKLENAGTSIFVSHYIAIKNEEEQAKDGWLLLVICIGMVFMVVIGESFYDLINSADFNLNKTIFKSIYIFGFLIIFLWLSRQYSLSKKQYLIYRHLSSAINSYSLINESLSDYTDLKKALLCEVSKTIFPIPDGKILDSQQIPLLQILDLAKNVASKDGNK